MTKDQCNMGKGLKNVMDRVRPSRHGGLHMAKNQSMDSRAVAAAEQARVDAFRAMAMVDNAPINTANAAGDLSRMSADLQTTVGMFKV